MYPEGLALQLTPDEKPGIFDAQDICWITFTDGGHGDPVKWQANIVLDTCRVLGVKYAFNEIGEEVTVGEFLEEYAGGIDFYE